MTEMRPKRDWWQKRRELDLWSIPHFLFGILMGMLPVITNMSPLIALVLTITLAVLWELYEKVARIQESVLNIFFDLLLPVVAFTLTSFVLFTYPLHPDDLKVVAFAVFAVFVFTNISGWRAYRRRHHNFIN